MAAAAAAAMAQAPLRACAVAALLPERTPSPLSSFSGSGTSCCCQRTSLLPHCSRISRYDVAGFRQASSHVLAIAAAGSSGESAEADTMLTEFMQYVDATQQLWPLEGRKPTALMPPTTVVRVQMDALMRNDWPEEDSGIKTAFAFAMPARVDEILSGKVRGPVSAVRAWDAAERYLTFEEFGKVIGEPMYSPLLNCSEWEVLNPPMLVTPFDEVDLQCFVNNNRKMSSSLKVYTSVPPVGLHQVASPLMFHGPGDRRGLQAVRVITQSAHGDKSRVYTFCLEKVQNGAYKDCWMVVGLRVGDYANV